MPRVHDVSNILEDHKKNIGPEFSKSIDRLGAISRELRRDRELAFYGTEDLTPSEFYKKKDAVIARDHARTVIQDLKKLWEI